MTACAEYESRLHALLDGELDAANSVECERHIAACDACQTALAQLQELRQSLIGAHVRFVAPSSLRARIATTIEAAAHSSPQVKKRVRSWFDLPRFVWPAMSSALAVGLAVVLIGNFTVRTTPDPTDEVIAGHVRSLQANHLVDVPTSDRHVVKPWFAGRVDFSPPVLDLSDRGFDLIGGRLDYFQNHPAAALAYHRRAHVINLFVWPISGADAKVATAARSGYNVVHWQRNGMAFWAVSDLNMAELLDLQSDYATRAGQ